MLGSSIEQWQEIMREVSEPLQLRLSSLQPTNLELFIAQINRDCPVATKVGLVLCLSVVFWIVSFVTRPRRLEKKLGLPVVSGSRTLEKDFVAVVERGRQMHPDQPFIVNSSGRQFVVYPPRNFDEIKSLSEEEANAQNYFYDVTYGSYTHIGAETPALWKTIVTDLARAGPSVISTKQEDARISFDRYVGDCPEWKIFTLFDTMMKIVALTNSASFVGRELAGGKWHKLVSQLSMTTFFPIMLLPWIPRLIQPLAAPFLFLPNLKVQRDMRRLLEPIIKQDLDEWKAAKDKDKRDVLKVKEGERLPYHKWLMSRYDPGEATPRQLATDQILTAFESTVSTAIFLYNVLLDLAARPDVQDELRQEIVENTVDGQLPSTNLKELRKMDSVMRETFRTSPSALFSLYRVIRKPLQLSTGPTLPVGTIICVDIHHINNSPSLFPAPSDYDPYRFLKQRAEPGAEHRHQFVSTGARDPNFGDGTQACPGRFWANITIKVCLAHVLGRYQVKLPGGVKPQPICMPNGIWVPDMKAKLLFQNLE